MKRIFLILVLALISSFVLFGCDDPIDEEKYTLTINVSSEMASVTGAGDYKSGASVTVTMTPKAGYEIDGWYEGTVKKSSNLSYTFTMPENDLTLDAKLNASQVVPKKHTLSLVVDPEMGEVTGAGEYEALQSVTVTVTPKEGYEIDGWYEGNVRKSGDLSYTFIMPAADHTLEVKLLMSLIVYKIDGKMLLFEMVFDPNDMKFIMEFGMPAEESGTPAVLQISYITGIYENTNDTVEFKEITSYKMYYSVFGETLDVTDYLDNAEMSADEMNTVIHVTDTYVLFMMDEILIYAPLSGGIIPDEIPELPKVLLTVSGARGYNQDVLGGYAATVDIGSSKDDLIAIMEFFVDFDNGLTINSDEEVEVIDVTGVDFNTKDTYDATVTFTYLGTEYTCNVPVRIGIGYYYFDYTAGYTSYIPVGTTLEDFVSKIKFNLVNDPDGTIMSDIELTADMVSGYDSSVEAELDITITYEYDGNTYIHTARYTFYNEESPGIMNINLQSGNIYTRLYAGENIADDENIKFNIYYYDGSYDGIPLSSEGVSISEFDNEKIGVHRVTISYLAFSETILVVVYDDDNNPDMCFNPSFAFVNVDADGNYIIVYPGAPEYYHFDHSYTEVEFDNEFFSDLEDVTPVKIADFSPDSEDIYGILDDAMNLCFRAMMYGSAPYVYVYEETKTFNEHEYVVYIVFLFLDDEFTISG